MDATPQKLINAGLYSSLATPWHSGYYRAVSIRLALVALGGRKPRHEKVLSRWLSGKWRHLSQAASEHGQGGRLLTQQRTAANCRDGHPVDGGAMVQSGSRHSNRKVGAELSRKSSDKAELRADLQAVEDL